MSAPFRIVAGLPFRGLSGARPRNHFLRRRRRWTALALATGRGDRVGRTSRSFLPRGEPRRKQHVSRNATDRGTAGRRDEEHGGEWAGAGRENAGREKRRDGCRGPAGFLYGRRVEFFRVPGIVRAGRATRGPRGLGVDVWARRRIRPGTSATPIEAAVGRKTKLRRAALADAAGGSAEPSFCTARISTWNHHHEKAEPGARFASSGGATQVGVCRLDLSEQEPSRTATTARCRPIAISYSLLRLRCCCLYQQRRRRTISGTKREMIGRFFSSRC